MLDEAETDRLLDALVEAGVLVEDERGLATTPAFEDTRGIYYDTYADASEEVFVSSVAEVFGLDPDEAAARIEELGITREGFVTYLALQSHLDDPPAQPELAAMARLAAEVGMDAVPPGVARVTDDDYAAFLDEHGDVVLTVWSYPCSPCEELKADLDEVRAAAPEGVAFAGADGSEVPDLRREFGVEAAPTTLLFRAGDLVETLRGYQSPAAMADAFDEVYG